MSSTYNLKSNLTEIDKKIEVIEEKYFINQEMSKETYDKFSTRLFQEKEQTLRAMANSQMDSSNLKKTFAHALTLSSKLPTVWASSKVRTKEKLQKLIFPEGVVYDLGKEAFRTKKVNSVFELIAIMSSGSGENETGQTETKFDLSS